MEDGKQLEEYRTGGESSPNSKRIVVGRGNVRALDHTSKKQSSKIKQSYVEHTKNLLNRSFQEGGPRPRSSLPSCKTFEEQTMNQLTCRICLERISTVANNPDITSPCKCQGSIMFIHITCLKVNLLLICL